MNTEHHKKIIESILADNFSDFKELIGNNIDSWKSAYPQMLNAMLHNKRVNFLTHFFETFPNIATVLNTQGYNIAHLFALKNYEWSAPVLDVLPKSVFSQCDSKGLTPFYSACASASNELWEKFLFHTDFKPNVADNNLNVSPLYLSVFSNSEYKVDRLLELGEDPNIKMSNGVSIIDVALGKNNWNILSSLANKSDYITPQFILSAVKDFSNSEKSIQALIDSSELQKKIFPLSQENKIPLWSYFFYYVSWDFIKKNESFLREKFIPELNKNSGLQSVVYSCFLGKRDSLKKFTWLIDNSKQISWKSINEGLIKNESTFGKEMPTGYAVYFDKLSTDELKVISKTSPSWLENASFEDVQVINLVLLSRELPLIKHKKSDLNNNNFHKELKAFEDGKDNANGVPLQFIINHLIKNVSKDLIKRNYSFLKNVCIKFKMINSVLYVPFVDDLKKAESPIKFFSEFVKDKSDNDFMEVVVSELLSTESSLENNNILEDLSHHKLYKRAIQNYISAVVSDSLGTKKSKRKLLNMDFPFYADLTWDHFDTNKIYPATWLNLIGACKYSAESLKLLDKIDLSSVSEFNKGNSNLRNPVFMYSDIILNLNLSLGVNVEFLNKVESLNSSKLSSAVSTYLLCQNNNLSKAVMNKCEILLSSLDKDNFKILVKELTKTDSGKKEEVFHVLKIAKDNEVDLKENYWSLMNDISPEFYVKVLNGVNDFTYFFDCLPLGKDIDVFSDVMNYKSESLVNYLQGDGLKDMKRLLSGFQPKDALFIATNVFSLQENGLNNEDKEILKFLISSSYKGITNSSNGLMLENAYLVFMKLLEKTGKPEFVVDFLDNTELMNYSGKIWSIEMRANNLQIVMNSHLSSIPDGSAEESSSDEIKLGGNTFKL